MDRGNGEEVGDVGEKPRTEKEEGSGEHERTQLGENQVEHVMMVMIVGRSNMEFAEFQIGNRIGAG